MDKKRQAAERIAGTHQRQIKNNHQGEQSQAAVAAQGFRVLDTDVKDAGRQHGEHEEYAAEQLHVFLGGDVAVGQQVLAVGGEHFVLLGGHANAGFDQRLAAGHLDDDRLEVAQGLFLQAPGGGVVEDQVGGDAIAEDPVERKAEIATADFGGEIDPQGVKGLFDRNGGVAGERAVGVDHLRNGELFAALDGEGTHILNTLLVEIAEDTQAGFDQGCAGGAGAGGEQDGHVRGGSLVRPERIKGTHEDREVVLSFGGQHRAGRVGALKLVERGGELAHMCLKLAQRLEIEAVDWGEAVAHLLASHAGFFSAGVTERGAG